MINLIAPPINALLSLKIVPTLPLSKFISELSSKIDPPEARALFAVN